MKKQLISCLLVILSGFIAYAQQGQGSIKLKAVDPNTGNEYYLFLHTANGKITGTYSEQQNAGAVYAINAAAVDNKIKGRMTDESGLLSFRFTCTPVREGGEEGLHLTLDNPLYEEMIPKLIFKPYTEGASTSPTPIDGPSTNGFDRALVGKWTTTDYYNSGEFSSTTRQTMMISDNATITVYESQMSANTGDSYINSSPGKAMGTMKIITANNQIFVVGDKSNQKAYLAKYTVQGNSLLTVAPDGKKEYWKK